uniref:WYL domain-containing protein n=1 Tax=uncultured bacterium contig00107 TaxID=1181573 RepID=A0A806K2F4_9BACT|nr:hypothetical protein [uncultured bacterium contig00107]
MSVEESCKSMIMVLDVLWRHSDEDHRLKQSQIAKHIREDYSVELQTKKIKRYLEWLVDLCTQFEDLPYQPYQIEYTEIAREDSDIWTDIYLEHDITDDELRMLIDGLLFSKYIPYSECKALIKKLEKLSSEHFQLKLKHIRRMTESRSENKDIFLTIGEICDAITKNKKLAFHFLEYGVDKVPRLVQKDGKTKEYVVSPYEIAVTNSRYYLICSHDGRDKFYHYRLDYIRDALVVSYGKRKPGEGPLSEGQKERLDYIRDILGIKNDKRRPIKEIVGVGRDLDLPKYMDEHIYMYTDDSASVVFRAPEYLVGPVLDWFGKSAVIVKDGDDSIRVTVDVSKKAMLYWALQYGISVEVLTPKELRDEIRDAVQGMWEKYCSTDEKIPTQNE